MMRIPFFKNTFLQLSEDAFELSTSSALEAKKFCEDWILKEFQSPILFTKSCSQALELAVLALDMPMNSEVIIPSYGFVSVGNAVVLAGHKCVFVDCDLETLNMCPDALETAITQDTKAVITINYGGVPCAYDRIIPLCRKHGLLLIEDNAHGLLSYVDSVPLGSFGDISTISFDSVKMITSFEGGAMIVNNKALWSAVAEATQMGTDRERFLRREVPQYQWVRSGTNASLALPLFIPLSAQLHKRDEIRNAFKSVWLKYASYLQPIAKKHGFRCSWEPEGCDTSGYTFWITLSDSQTRKKLCEHMDSLGIDVSRHYPALHRSEFGASFISKGSKRFSKTDQTAETVVRLPLFMNMSNEEVIYVIDALDAFFG